MSILLFEYINGRIQIKTFIDFYFCSDPTYALNAYRFRSIKTIINDGTNYICTAINRTEMCNL